MKMTEIEMFKEVLEVHTKSILREIDLFRSDVSSKFESLNKVGCAIGQVNKSRLDRMDGRSFASGASGGGVMAILLMLVQALLAAIGITFPKGGMQ